MAAAAVSAVAAAAAVGNTTSNVDCMHISVLISQINDWTHFSYVRFLTFTAYLLIFFFGLPRPPPPLSSVGVGGEGG